MVSERIVIDVNKKGASYNCTFVFRNEGPACKVRMGFPDRGEGAEETSYFEQLSEATSKKRPKPVFQDLTNFKSYVNGKPVKTEVVPVEEKPESWHVKTVTFGKGQTLTVRDTFSADFGFGLTRNGAAERRRYIMSTGASWKGKIGTAEVIVRFAKGLVPGQMRPYSLAKLMPKKDDNGFSYKGWPSLPKGAIVWTGFATPTVSGNQLRFFRRDFEPTKKSDIDLYFGWKKVSGNI